MTGMLPSIFIHQLRLVGYHLGTANGGRFPQAEVDGETRGGTNCLAPDGTRSHGLVN